MPLDLDIPVGMWGLCFSQLHLEKLPVLQWWYAPGLALTQHYFTIGNTVRQKQQLQ